MKFKSVFILFNIAVGASFLFVFAMPFMALGGGIRGDVLAGELAPGVGPGRRSRDDRRVLRLQLEAFFLT